MSNIDIPTKSSPKAYAQSSKGYEAIGRIHQALLASNAIDGHDSLDAWITLDGGYAVEWFGGPHSHEAAQAFIEFADYPEDNTLQPSDISPFDRHLESYRSVLWVRGLRLELRAMSPIGKDQVIQNAINKARPR